MPEKDPARTAPQTKSLIERLLLPILLALLTAGTSPWWYTELREFFTSKSKTEPKKTNSGAAKTGDSLIQSMSTERKILTTKKLTAESRAGDGNGHPRDGAIEPEDGWCFDETGAGKVQFVVEVSDNNNLPHDRLTKVQSISKKRMVFTVINNPAERHIPSRTVAYGLIEEYKCE